MVIVMAVVAVGIIASVEVARWLGLELAYLWRAGYNGDRHGGPCPSTSKCTNTDYVYVMEFQGDKILHMNQIWNAGGP